MELLDPQAPVRGVATMLGRVLEAATGAVAALRPAPKPLHPDGVVMKARLVRLGSDEPTGVAWLDEPGESDAVLRTSRAVGLPPSWPDIHGLAVRVVDAADGPGDLLLASTGMGRVGRFVLTASRDPRARPLTTLLPYRTPSGPVLLGARWEAWNEFTLCWARPGGRWHPFGAIIPTEDPHADQDVSFDPLLNQIPGLNQYGAIIRLREPAYALARRSRRSS